MVQSWRQNSNLRPSAPKTQNLHIETRAKTSKWAISSKSKKLYRRVNLKFDLCCSQGEHRDGQVHGLQLSYAKKERKEI